MSPGRRNRNWGSLFVGLLLLTLGVVFLGREMGWIGPVSLFDGWWALILVVAGLAKLVQASRAKDVGGGVTLTLLGAWLFAAHTGWQGLRYHNSWPLALVAVGAGMVVRALAQQWMTDRVFSAGEEDRHV